MLSLGACGLKTNHKSSDSTSHWTNKSKIIWANPAASQSTGDLPRVKAKDHFQLLQWNLIYYTKALWSLRRQLTVSLCSMCHVHGCAHGRVRMSASVCAYMCVCTHVLPLLSAPESPLDWRLSTFCLNPVWVQCFAERCHMCMFSLFCVNELHHSHTAVSEQSIMHPAERCSSTLLY